MLVHVRASQSVRRLLDLEPPTARRLRATGEEAEIPVEELDVGDLIRIRPGDRIPIDGVVTDGASAVDESLVTGEPLAADKLPGSEVIGGSVNQAGSSPSASLAWVPRHSFGQSPGKLQRRVP